MISVILYSLQETMKMMGLRTYVYWLSWFAKNFIYLIFIVAIYVIIFNIPIGDKGKVIKNIDPSVFFVFLLLYIMANIAFAFMISTFFKKGIDLVYF